MSIYESSDQSELMVCLSGWAMKIDKTMLIHHENNFMHAILLF